MILINDSSSFCNPQQLPKEGGTWPISNQNAVLYFLIVIFCFCLFPQKNKGKNASFTRFKVKNSAISRQI
ncbi:hypothetical protein GQ457_01G035580 [Hibiscus cannabinus]